MTEVNSGMHDGEDAEMLVFRRPGLLHGLNFSAFGIGMFAFMACMPGMLDDHAMVAITAGFCTVLVAIFLVLSIQCVIIEGSRVRVKSLTTGFRWRGFDAGEVTQLRVSPAGHGQIAHGLRVSLLPAPHRRWNDVALSSFFQVKYHEGLDVPVFLALTRAVTCLQPDLRVQGLPTYYSGALPTPRPSHGTGYEDAWARGVQVRADANRPGKGSVEPRREKKRRKGKR
jgi:hypothetical protein